MPLQRRSPSADEFDNVTLVVISEEDMQEPNIQAVGEELFAIADGMPQGRLELDMAAVGYLSSASFGTLLSLRKRLREGGGSLVLANVSSAVYGVFEATRLHCVLDIRR